MSKRRARWSVGKQTPEGCREEDETIISIHPSSQVFGPTQPILFQEDTDGPKEKKKASSLCKCSKSLRKQAPSDKWWRKLSWSRIFSAAFVDTFTAHSMLHTLARFYPICVYKKRRPNWEWLSRIGRGRVMKWMGYITHIQIKEERIWMELECSMEGRNILAFGTHISLYNTANSFSANPPGLI